MMQAEFVPVCRLQISMFAKSTRERIGLSFPSSISKRDSLIGYGAAEQSLAADGAIASFSSNLVPSAWMLIARRS
jgi:hypothetical protein